MIKTILLDMDGTIIDSAPGIMRCINLTLEHYGLARETNEVLRKCCGPPLSLTLKDRFHLPAEQITGAIQYYRKKYNESGIYECELFPGMRELLKELYDRGYDLVVTSSKHEVACEQIVDRFGIAEYFYDVVGSAGDVSRETKREVINSFFEAHPDHRREEAILIGDTIYDAEGAGQSGVAFAAVTYGYGDRPELEQTQARALFATPGDILEYIEREN